MIKSQIRIPNTAQFKLYMLLGLLLDFTINFLVFHLHNFRNETQRAFQNIVFSRNAWLIWRCTLIVARIAIYLLRIHHVVKMTFVLTIF